MGKGAEGNVSKRLTKKKKAGRIKEKKGNLMEVKTKDRGKNEHQYEHVRFELYYISLTMYINETLHNLSKYIYKLIRSKLSTNHVYVLLIYTNSLNRVNIISLASCLTGVLYLRVILFFFLNLLFACSSYLLI